jgi:hypothetical protein
MDFALELGMATRARQDLAGRAQRFSVRLLRVVADLLRECRETSHALGILRELGKGDPAEVAWLLGEVHEFTAMLVVSVRKLRDPAP